MKPKIVLTSNVARFVSAVKALQRLDMVGEERMGLLWGIPGEGKSTTISYFLNQHDGILLHACRSWTMSSMLADLMIELGMSPGRIRHRMVKAAVQALKAHPRPIFVDEADYLFGHSQTDILDVLRDIYDEAKIPVVLIGMEDIARRLRSDDRLSRFRRRITQWVEFKGLTPQDTHLVAAEVCDVAVAGDLLDRLYRETRANMNSVILGLKRIEEFGKDNAETLAVADAAEGPRPLVTLKDFGARPLLPHQTEKGS